MLQTKIKEVAMAVSPIVLIVLLLHFLVIPLTSHQLSLFLVGAGLLFIGMVIFLLGVEISITRMGEILGQGLVKKNQLIFLIIGSLIIGLTASLAEPSIAILGRQIAEMSHNALSQATIMAFVAGGFGIMLMVGMCRIVFSWDIVTIMTAVLGLIALVATFVSEEFFTIAFDSSGASTGAIAVPFILALSVGAASIATTDDQGDDQTFGLVGTSALGPILGIFALGLLFQGDLTGEVATYDPTLPSIGQAVSQEIGTSIQSVLVGSVPLVIIFGLYHYFIERQSTQTVRDIMIGMIYLFIGLVLFLTGVNSGFMPIGRHMGYMLYSEGYAPALLVGIGFIFGVASILAEPGAYVLTDQVEETTGGTLPRSIVLTTIALGVGAAVGLTVWRVLTPSFRLWHVLLPGYILILLLGRKVPRLFVGMGLDSGAVASGPMNGTFIFAFIQGIAMANPSAHPITDGMGLIGVVAMTPVLFIELLGYVSMMIDRRNQED